MKNLVKISSILIVFTAVLLLTAGKSRAQQDTGQLFEKALFTEEVKGNLSEAVKLYQQVLEKKPDNRQLAAKALLHMGICYEKLGLEQARQTYRDVINKFSEQEKEVALAKERVNRLEAYAADLSRKAELCMKKGNELFKRWEYESAVKEFENAIKLDPNSLLALNARYCIGQSWFRAGKYDAALATFTKLTEENPESSIAPVSELMVAQVQHVLENTRNQNTVKYYTDENKIVDPETGITYTKIKTFTGKNDVINEIGGSHLSPDGRFVVLENKVVPLNGSDPFDLVDMKALRATYATGMKKAAFFADSAIWIVPVSPETGHANGQPEKLLSGSYKYQNPVSWSPDGEKIAFTRMDKTTTYDIWTLSVSDGRLLPVTDSPGVKTCPAWSPDGKTIAYMKDRGIWLVPANGGESKMILRTGEVPQWSPDGKWLYLSNWESNHFYSLDSNKNIRFTAPEQVGNFIGFSPNGGKILLYRSSYHNKWGSKVVSVSGGPSFSPLASGDVYGSRWLPDSKNLLVVCSPNEGVNFKYKIIPLRGGNPVELKTDAKVDVRQVIGFSRDFTKLAFSVKREDGRKDLYIIPFSMQDATTVGPPKLIFEGWVGGAFNVTTSWSPDGKKMALIHEGDIWIVPLEGGDPVKITDTPEGERWIDWSPDGKMISYIIPLKQTAILYTIPAKGGISKVLYNDCEGGSIWSPDCKNITVFSNNKLIFITLDGEKVKEIAIPKEYRTGNSSDFQYSPNGKYIAFIASNEDEFSILLYSIENNEFTRLAFENLNDEKYFLNWSPDGKWLSYITYEGVKVRPEGTLWEADFKEIKEKLAK
jgi:Tol biopolymer transport system component/outer membrane protein assembly factor BamD (BamD/ComL family)